MRTRSSASASPPASPRTTLAAEVRASVDLAGEVATIRAPDPQPVLYRLITWAERERLALDGLEVVRPTLEEMFLELTADPMDATSEGSGDAD